MPDVSFTNLLVVMAVAVLAPLIVGYLPRVRVPAVVLEIVGGIIIGPSVLGWVHVDLPVSILALFGLAFLLFLAGLEIDVHRLRGRLLRYAVLGYLVSLVLGYGASASWRGGGRTDRRTAPDVNGHAVAGPRSGATPSTARPSTD
jgi:Kef-type K+ transport system membrane component KefB